MKMVKLWSDKLNFFIRQENEHFNQLNDELNQTKRFFGDMIVASSMRYSRGQVMLG